MSILDYFKMPEGLKEIEVEHLDTKNSNAKIIDVRTEGEYEKGHIDNSVNIPLSQIRKHIEDYGKEDEILLICATGHRSRAAAKNFLENGYQNVSHLKGGMMSYNKLKRRGKS